jgi:hypothetical protein
VLLMFESLLVAVLEYIQYPIAANPPATSEVLHINLTSHFTVVFC